MCMQCERVDGLEVRGVLLEIFHRDANLTCPVDDLITRLIPILKIVL